MESCGRPGAHRNNGIVVQTSTWLLYKYSIMSRLQAFETSTTLSEHPETTRSAVPVFHPP